MIVFDLLCSAGHRFEGWFSSADDFEEIFGKGVRGCVPMIAQVRQVGRLSVNEMVEVAVGNRTYMRQLGIIVTLSLLSERERLNLDRRLG